jgi:hypothetical protein
VEGVTSSDCHSNGELCYVRTDELRPSVSAYNLMSWKGVSRTLLCQTECKQITDSLYCVSCIEMLNAERGLALKDGPCLHTDLLRRFS